MEKSTLRGKIKWRDYVPKLITSLRKGYNLSKFSQDFFAGVTIGVISLPLAMAFAIGSGLPPEKGLFTAIIAGFLISALGGSRFQIGGPTGAFVVIVFDVVQRNGYEGLAIATIIAGVLLVLMGLLRFGALLKFIPYPVVVGLTTGLALVLFSSQIKDFLGLTVANPVDFLDKWAVFYHNVASTNITALLLGLFVVIFMLVFKRFSPKIPAAIIAVILATLIATFFNLPVETIQTKFGGIPNLLPMPSFPTFTADRIRDLMPDAITIAVLAGLESLLSATVADGMTGFRHKSNCELVGQGIGNIGSIIFGGMPATGAIARTATNVRLGAKTPISGIVHAITLFFILFLFAPLASKIPLTALAGVLIVIAWNMAELDHCREIFKGPKTDVVLLFATFGLTVLIDITVAVEIGILLAALFFMKRMADATDLSKKALTDIVFDQTDEREIPHKNNIPEEIEVVEINGPLFFGAADLLSEALSFLKKEQKVMILRMNHVTVIDMTGLRALDLFHEKCKNLGLALCLSGLSPKVIKTLTKAKLDEEIGKDRIFSSFDEALDFSREYLVQNIHK